MDENELNKILIDEAEEISSYLINNYRPKTIGLIIKTAIENINIHFCKQIINAESNLKLVKKEADEFKQSLA